MESSSEDEGGSNVIDNQSAYERAKAAVKDYLTEPRIQYDHSPLQYWKLNMIKRPELAKVCVTLAKVCILEYN